MADPVPGDVDAPRDPDLLVRRDVIEETRQRRGAPGTADEPAMQADRHHLRRGLAFRIERVESVLQIGEELVAGIEALRRGEAHVVGVERIGHDQLLPFAVSSQ